MELSSIINQYYDTFMIKYADTALPGHLKAMNAIRVAHRIPVNFMWSVRTAIMGNGGLYLVVTGVAQNVRTMRPANGSTVSCLNCCLFPISWRPLHYLMN